MKDILRKLATLLAQAATENGKGSYSRLVGLLIIVNTLAWVWYAVLKSGTLPNLTDAAVFISVGAGTPYAINQAKTVASAIKGTSTVDGN